MVQLLKFIKYTIILISIANELHLQPQNVKQRKKRILKQFYSLPSAVYARTRANLYLCYPIEQIEI